MSGVEQFMDHAHFRQAFGFRFQMAQCHLMMTFNLGDGDGQFHGGHFYQVFVGKLIRRQVFVRTAM